MKRTTILTTIVSLCLAILPSCNGNTPVSNKKISKGAPYEIIVAVDSPQWEGRLGDSLRSVLLEPIPMLNQVEPMFNVLRVVRSGVKSLVAEHRNILTVMVDTAFHQPASQAKYDVVAAPQISVAIVGPDTTSLAEYIGANRAELQQLFNATERDRWLTNLSRHGEKRIEESILDKFGMKMSIPLGYTVRNTIGDNFVWLSKEYPQASQGIVIYSEPYSGKADLSAESLIERRNRMVAQIPGPSDGSFMTTATEFTPEYRVMEINNRSWAELRGFWDVDGDFMGGPMVSYTTLNPNNSSIITIDCYVFSPKIHKRNYLRELENLIYTVSFPQRGSTEK